MSSYLQSTHLPTQPPGWGSEPLTEFFVQSTKNAWATYCQSETQSWVRSAQHIDAVFIEATEALNSLNDSNLEVVVILHHTISAFRTAVQLAMESKTSETYAIIRLCIECSLLASYLTKNPNLIGTWTSRSESRERRKEFRGKFSNGKMLNALRDTEYELGKRVEVMYELAIDLGAHPNELAVSNRLLITSLPNGSREVQTSMPGNNKLIPVVLKDALRSGVMALECFEIIFKEHFDRACLTKKIKELKYVYE